MEQKYSISRYIVKCELDIEKMIKDFKGYIYTIIENNSYGKLTYEDKEEIMSDVFLTVWHNKKKIDNNRPLKNYIAGITKNLIRNKFKDKKYSNNEIRLEDDEIQDLSNIDIICEQRQALEVITKELNNMEQEEYQIFSKYYYFSKSIKEIATELGLSESNVKVKLHRIRKKLKKELQIKGFLYKALSIIIVLCMITGVVYASVKLINKMQENDVAEPIKWAGYEIQLNGSEELLEENMEKYDKNIYMLNIKDYETFKEKQEKLSISFKEDKTTDIDTFKKYEYEAINKDTFEKYGYDILLVVFKDHPSVKLHNVSPYTKKLTIDFTYKRENMEKQEQMAFGILIPKLYNRDIKEIVYEDEKKNLEMPEGATQFRFASFYIENIEEFDKINLHYDEEQDIFYTDALNKEGYKQLAESLKIVTKNAITENNLKEAKDIILVFKKTDNKLELRRMKSIQNEPEKMGIVIKETEEKYGNGITGELIIIKTNPSEGYKFYME